MRSNVLRANQYPPTLFDEALSGRRTIFTNDDLSELSGGEMTLDKFGTRPSYERVNISSDFCAF